MSADQCSCVVLSSLEFKALTHQHGERDRVGRCEEYQDTEQLAVEWDTGRKDECDDCDGDDRVAFVLRSVGSPAART